MDNYAIEILTNELKELKENIEWVEDPKSVRYYTDDDREDLKRWKRQVNELDEALKILKDNTSKK